MTLQEIAAMPPGLDAVTELLQYINEIPVPGAYLSNLERYHVARDRNQDCWRNPEFIDLLIGPLGTYIVTVSGDEGSEMDARIREYVRHSRRSAA